MWRRANAELRKLRSVCAQVACVVLTLQLASAQPAGSSTSSASVHVVTTAHKLTQAIESLNGTHVHITEHLDLRGLPRQKPCADCFWFAVSASLRLQSLTVCLYCPECDCARCILGAQS